MEIAVTLQNITKQAMTAIIVFSTGALKMTDMKLQDMKMTDQIAGHEIAGHENDGPNSRA